MIPEVGDWVFFRPTEGKGRIGVVLYVVENPYPQPDRQWLVVTNAGTCCEQDVVEVRSLESPGPSEIPAIA